MRILVTGAYGLIGSACLARLHGAGHDLVAAGRVAAARRRFPYARWITADFARLTKPELWLPILAGIDAVVNCVGVLQDGVRDNVQRVQFDGTVALFEACVQSGVRRVVHISAIGAEPDGPSVFARSKAAAEVRLKTLALDWVILRPGLVLAPAAHGGNALLRGLAAFPLCSPLIGADAAIQTVDINDVAETVAQALAPDAPAKVVWDVAHPQANTLADIVRAMRGWLGFPPRRVLPVPRAVAATAATLGDAARWLGWRSPLSSTALAQLKADVVGDPRDWMVATGIVPRSLEDFFAAHPAAVQDRWFARLYLLKPLAIAGLAVATLTTGIVHLVAYSKTPHLAEIWSMQKSYVLFGLFEGAVICAVGVGLAVRRTARLSLVCLLFLAFMQDAYVVRTAARIGFFPFSLFEVGIVIILAILFTLAILDER